MKLMAEGTKAEAARIMEIAGTVLAFRSVSEFKPNALNSITDPHGRMWATLESLPDRDIVDLLAEEMLALADGAGMLDDVEAARIRSFHEAGKRNPDACKLMALHRAWLESLIKRIKEK